MMVSSVFWMATLLTLSASALAGDVDSAPRLDFGAELVQVLGGLLLVLGLVVALAWLTRRLNGARFNGAGRLRLVGGLSLGSRERILVVEVEDVHLVLGVAPGRVQTLHVLDRPLQDEDLSPAEGEEGFSRRLGRLLGRQAQS